MSEAATLRRDVLTENEISREIVDAAFKIHTRLGPGLLESVYEVVLAHELKQRGLNVVRQVAVPIVWDDIRFEEGYRLDLLVDDKVVVEVKSIESVERVHKKQVLTYLRLLNKRLGILINFNEELIRDGISRVANGLEE
ncbi:MAG TPA: GxxExxY protein [Lacipirellulaceae bacterium]|jgi:GxxExxY protein|nr:GxxExxY protein [Lacipirellulaceae bacterium]